MQTRSQTRQTLLSSLRTRNQTKLVQQSLQVYSLPRITRSPTKKPKKPPVISTTKDESDGVYINTGLSATGHGMHIRWEYPKEQFSIETPNHTVPSRIPSYSSLFEGTLSSISSEESSHSSASFSSIQSGPPNTDFTYPQTSDWESNPNLTSTSRHSTIASQPVRPAPRPLQRAGAHQWEQIGESSTNEPVSSANSIFSRQLVKLADQRKVLENVEMEFETGFGEDTASIADTELDLQSHSDETDHRELHSNGSSAGLPSRLGPCGTELIEDEHKAPSDRMTDYPSTWASRRSTHLTMFPTQQEFDSEMGP